MMGNTLHVIFGFGSVLGGKQIFKFKIHILIVSYFLD